jgi:predicted enzyme related to lactoylglutathione lyase
VTDIHRYAPGAPCWVDLSTPDPDGAIAYYRDLFGWAATDPDEWGMRTFTLAGRKVAGVGPCDGDRPASWNVYLHAPDIEAAVTDVAQFGGQVLIEPTEVDTRGWGAACVDPTGAVFTLWQPGEHIGTQIANVPGAWCWTELITTDAGAAAQFYADVFGWVVDLQTVNGVELGTASIDDQPIAGIAAPSPDIQPSWTVAFSVTDVDRVARIATALGGAMAIPPTEVPGMGRYAALGSALGEAFTVITRPGD